MLKCLFLYLNTIKIPAIHNGLALLLSIAKSENFYCELFDTTFMDDDYIDSLFKEKITQLKPDIIAVNSYSHNWVRTRKLLMDSLDTKDKDNIYVVVGGPHPTVAPHFVISCPIVDMVVIGEGEAVFRKILKCVSKKENLDQIQGLWYKKNGVIYRNALADSPPNIECLPEEDWSLFNRKHLIQNADRSKRIMKLAYFYTTRGCPYSCTYCTNAYYQNLYNMGNKKYYCRDRAPENVIDEIDNKYCRYKFTNIFFSDESFSLNIKRLRHYSQLYTSRVGIPFTIQTRLENITDESLSILSHMGIEEICFGIESGSEEYRRVFLNRYISNKEILNKVKLIKKYKIKITTYNMIGLPFETSAMINDTLEINKYIEPDYANLFVFFPLPGTELFKLCLTEGLFTIENPYEVDYQPGSSIIKTAITKEEIDFARKNLFNHSDSRIF